MPEAFSFNREFDFVRLDGLRRATGRPSHEWDLYILKELIDNALDADGKWTHNHDGTVDITIDIHYRHNEAQEIHALEIAVRNRAPFPLDFELLTALFDLTAYTSNKSHTNY